MSKKVMLGMSGGVDSAMSAHLLKSCGYNITAVNCCFYKDESYSEDAVSDARAVSEKLGIDFTVEDLTDAFRAKVIESFVSTYVKGGTPNPCIVCNKSLKFGAMLDKALKEGYDYIATGHYARIENITFFRILWVTLDLRIGTIYDIINVNESIIIKEGVPYENRLEFDSHHVQKVPQ